MKTISPSDVRRVLTDRREYLAKKKQAAYESGKPFGYESSEIAVIDWVLERVAAKDVPTEEEAGDQVRVAAALEEVSFPGYRFRVGRIAGAFLQVVYDEPDVESGEPTKQHGRKWYVSGNATRGEIIQTAFKAVMTSHEHRVREHFTWRGARLFGPHFDLEQLAALALSGATEQRPAPAAEPDDLGLGAALVKSLALSDAAPQLPAAGSLPTVDPAYPFTMRALAIAWSPLVREARGLLRAGNPRGAAAYLAERERRAEERERVQIALALNHLPTPWVVACRAMEDAIAAGAPSSGLREAARTGDPTALAEELVGAFAGCMVTGKPQAAGLLMEAGEAVKREMADAG